MKKEKEYNLVTSNRIIYEDLSKIEDSVFEEVYREADWTLYKIIQDVEQYSGKKEKDDCSLNVLSFLGERGRGKTSTMLSFLFSLNELDNYEWSTFHDRKDEIKFIKLPYVDAAMLAEKEYIFDVILAEMWDVFEEQIKKGSKVNEDSEYLEQKIKRAFIDVRKAYLVIKEKEKNIFNTKDKDMTTPGQLHELAASLNLCKEIRKLVNFYLDFFNYDQNTYLVITIDDIDMSGDKAYLILEQIRRFLRIPRIIILITADINRLQKVCEAYYKNIYPDECDRQRFINEYLEKVLPYNMRMYMPEVKERYDDIKISLPQKEKDILDLKSQNEKDMILEFIAKKCEIFFDGSRRKRHFLQNYSMRSMVNYFEQLIRITGIKEIDYVDWLKIDLKERLVERIQNAKQREFMRELLAKDYEDINRIIVNYVNSTLQSEEKILKEYSLGQVLYGCNLLEKEDPESVHFVNCILMFYSIIVRQVYPDKNKNRDLWKKIFGNSLLGEWDYMAVSGNPKKFDMCQGFNETGKLRIDITNFLKSQKTKSSFNELIKQNEEDIIAWIYSLMFVTVIPSINGDITFEINKIEVMNEKATKKLESAYLDLKPNVVARKSYFNCLYCQELSRIYDNVFSCFTVCMEMIKEWAEPQLSEDDKKLESIVSEWVEKIWNEIKRSEVKLVIPAQNVEIFYSIGQAIDKIMISVSTEEELFNQLSLKYREIQKTLQKIDKYNKKIQIETKFEKNFMETCQAKLLLGGLESSVRRKFKQKLGKLLSEAYGTGSTIVLEPQGH